MTGKRKRPEPGMIGRMQTKRARATKGDEGRRSDCWTFA